MKEYKMYKVNSVAEVRISEHTQQWDRIQSNSHLRCMYFCVVYLQCSETR